MNIEHRWNLISFDFRTLSGLKSYVMHYNFWFLFAFECWFDIALELYKSLKRQGIMELDLLLTILLVQQIL